MAGLVQSRTVLTLLATGSPHAPSGSRDMKFGGSKTTEVHQERRARPWRAPGGGLDPKERVKPESVVGAVLGRPKEVRSPPDGASSKKGITKTVVGTAQGPSTYTISVGDLDRGTAPAGPKKLHAPLMKPQWEPPRPDQSRSRRPPCCLACVSSWPCSLCSGTVKLTLTHCSCMNAVAMVNGSHCLPWIPRSYRNAHTL